ncbi:MAG: hypothetical protein HY043_18210 [Verrucomicrobia bacterium]|nr:hypothetical protein [Verrucomicrobiota bacterium]
MTKSEAAFRLSAGKFFAETRRIYFWTFTVKRVLADWHYAQLWARFVRELEDVYGGTVQGVKVVELHKSHGIHWHALLNRRIDVREVRRIGAQFGIGRVHVKLANHGSISYLAKYVSKQFKRSQKLHAHCARWGTVGGFRGVRVQDIEVDSVFHRAVRFCQRELGLKQLPFLFVCALLDKRTEDPALLRRACANYRATGSINLLWSVERTQASPRTVARHLRALKR